MLDALPCNTDLEGKACMWPETVNRETERNKREIKEREAGEWKGRLRGKPRKKKVLQVEQIN